MAINMALKRFKQIWHTGVRRDELAPIWLDVLRGVAMDDFKLASEAYLLSEAKFFPTPGQLLALCKKCAAARHPSNTIKSSFLEDYKAWCGHYDGPCPVCGVEWGPIGNAENKNPRFLDFDKTIADLTGGKMAPLRQGVLHIKKDHDTLEVPIRWREKPVGTVARGAGTMPVKGLLHDGFWR